VPRHGVRGGGGRLGGAGGGVSGLGRGNLAQHPEGTRGEDPPADGAAQAVEAVVGTTAQPEATAQEADP
jgi:hypothetical protein